MLYEVITMAVLFNWLYYFAPVNINVMRNFTYEASTRIIFGQERLVELPLEIKKYTSKVLLAYGEGSIKKSGLYDKVLEELQKEAIVVVELPDISANPQIESVRMGVTLCT